MQRREMDMPLLIGGATTSIMHTAVRIAPQYAGPVIYVQDASRAVGVASNLLSPTARDGFVAGEAQELVGIGALLVGVVGLRRDSR